MIFATGFTTLFASCAAASSLISRQYPAGQIGSAVINGLSGVGLNGDLGPNRLWSVFGHKGEPIIGLSELTSPNYDKPSKAPVLDGSQAKGPQKKPDRVYRWRTTNEITYTSISQLRAAKSGTRFASGIHVFRTKGIAGKALAVDIVAPYAHDLLNYLKKLDNPVGWAVTWFDDAMNNLQEAIGGEQVASIYGNKLKLALICMLRGDQPYPNAVDEDCKKLKEEKAAEKKKASDDALDGVCSRVNGGFYPSDADKSGQAEWRTICKNRAEERANAANRLKLLQTLQERIKQDMMEEVAWEKEKKTLDPSGQCFQEGKSSEQLPKECQALKARVETARGEKLKGAMDGLFQACDEALGVMPIDCKDVKCLFGNADLAGSITDKTLHGQVLSVCQSLRQEVEKTAQ